MSNHYHVILHIHREQTESWSMKKEVLSRWTQLFSGPVLVQPYLAGVTLNEGSLLKVEELSEEYRRRLKDISWFMRCLNEHLAREANIEDSCKGRFWEGRYKSQALLDEAALLICIAYVDLNPVRASMAKTPETSEYTSIKERAGSYCSTGTTRRQLSLLKPFKASGQNPDLAIPYALSCYLELVDWSGRIFRKDKRDRILETVPPILLRLNIDPEEWLNTIRWNNRFRHVMGTLPALKNHAVQTGKRWVHGMSVSRRLFLSETSNQVLVIV